MTTIDYYNQNAEKFFNETVNVDMSELYEPFIKLLPKGAKILDAGCGSGRDTLAFKKLGYQVTAFDACEKLAKLASAYIGQAVKHLRFEELDLINEFDGIWACASLLHISPENIKDVLIKILDSLKTNGIFYLSFKYGSDEYFNDGRNFNCYTEDSIMRLLEKLNEMKTLKIWVTNDLRKRRQNEKWLNILLKKT